MKCTGFSIRYSSVCFLTSTKNLYTAIAADFRECLSRDVAPVEFTLARTLPASGEAYHWWPMPLRVPPFDPAGKYPWKKTKRNASSAKAAPRPRMESASASPESASARTQDSLAVLTRGPAKAAAVPDKKRKRPGRSVHSLSYTRKHCT